MNIASIVARRAQIHPERIAVTDAADGCTYSYRELSERAVRFAEHFLFSDVRAGDRVGYLGANRIAAFDVMLGCAQRGAIFVPLNYRFSAAEIARVLADARPAWVIMDDEYSALLSDSPGVPTARPIPAPCDVSPYERPAPITAGEENDPFALIYTSGSTGAPKGVIQTHRNAFFRALAGIVDFDMTSRDVVLVAAPLFHVAGLNALTLSALHIGARIVLQPRFNPDQTLQLIAREQVSCLAVAPTMLKMMSATPNFTRANLASLRFILVGGEPLESAVQTQWREMGVELLNVFGMSETTDGALYQRIGNRTAANCIGRPASYVDVRIGEAGEYSDVGELFIAGPAVAPGYWGDAERSRGVFQNGWVRTGDLVSRDAAGDFYVIGRADDMIKSGAEKIAPAELEDVIGALPEVESVVVFGVPDEKWGQSARAVIARKPGVQLTEASVLEACSRTLASYKKPRSIVIVDELSKTGSGKVDRAAVKQQYGGRIV